MLELRSGDGGTIRKLAKQEAATTRRLEKQSEETVRTRAEAGGPRQEPSPEQACLVGAGASEEPRRRYHPDREGKGTETS